MAEWIAQPNLLAAGDDFSEWANILFIVIILLFSVVGGLIKNSGARKTQRQAGGGAPRRPPTDQRRETWQQRLARKAEEMQRAFEAKYEEAQRSVHGPPPARPKPPEGGKLTVRTDARGESVMVFEKERPEVIARQEAARERQAREAVAAARRLEAQRRLVAPREHQARPASETSLSQEPARMSPVAPMRPGPTDRLTPLIDYNDPDALKKAVLHYEILGRPLALRDPFERSSQY